MGGGSSPSDVEFLNNDIPVRVTQRSLGKRNYAGRPKIRTLIPIPEHNAPTNKSNQLPSLPPPQTKVPLPSLILSNVMSLAPKIDEVRYCAQDANLDLICLTETWLQSHIEDNAVSISGFNLVRKDWQLGVHGGICVFVKNSIPFIVLDDLIISTIEVLWIELRPKRLPRGVNSIILGTVYHPPNSNDTVMLEYLMDCSSSIESQYPNSEPSFSETSIN